METLNLTIDGREIRTRNGNTFLEAAVYEASRCLKCDPRLRITPVKFRGDY